VDEHAEALLEPPVATIAEARRSLERGDRLRAAGLHPRLQQGERRCGLQKATSVHVT